MREKLSSTRKPSPAGAPTSMRQLLVPRSSAAKAGPENRCVCVVRAAARSAEGASCGIIAILSYAGGRRSKGRMRPARRPCREFTPREDRTGKDRRRWARACPRQIGATERVRWRRAASPTATGKWRRMRTGPTQAVAGADSFAAQAALQSGPPAERQMSQHAIRRMAEVNSDRHCANACGITDRSSSSAGAAGVWYIDKRSSQRRRDRQAGRFAISASWRSSLVNIPDANDSCGARARTQTGRAVPNSASTPAAFFHLPGAGG